MSELEAVTEWLQGPIPVNGKERAAPQEVTDLLLQSFGQDAWDVDDILEISSWISLGAARDYGWSEFAVSEEGS